MNRQWKGTSTSMMMRQMRRRTQLKRNWRHVQTILTAVPTSKSAEVNRTLELVEPWRFSAPLENLERVEGPYRFGDNSIYYGQMLNDKREGEGRQLFADGSLYEGQWLDKKHHGKGRFIYTNG